MLFSYALIALVLFVVIVLPRLGTISSKQARKLVEGGALLVDVRTPGEFANGHLEGAVNAPLGELDLHLGKLGGRERPLVLYCASGMRSMNARKMLQAKGFTQVFNLGGMGRW